MDIWVLGNKTTQLWETNK